MSGRRVSLAFVLAGLFALASMTPAVAAEESRPYKAAVVYDPQSETFVRTWKPDEPLPPASLTKMVTALVVADRLHPSDPVQISEAAALAPHDAIRWPQGATFTVDDVLHGMMMMSSNGAAIAIAETISGSVDDFLPLMNERARKAGATKSTFRTPHGLDARGQRATARDLALIAAEVVHDPWLMRVISTRTYMVPWTNDTTATFGNLNRLMFQMKDAIGVKPGYTRRAGNCLAGAALRNGRMMIAVVLNDEDVYRNTRRLLEFGFRTAPKGTAWDGPTPLEPERPQVQSAAAARRAIEQAEAVSRAPVAVTRIPTARSRPFLLHVAAWAIASVALRRILAGGRRRRPVRRAAPRPVPVEAYEPEPIWQPPILIDVTDETPESNVRSLRI